MRQARRSVKDKIRDLKRVLDDGIDAINETILEPITAMFVLPGNGRDEPTDTVLEIDRNGSRTITQQEYEARYGKTVTTKTTEVVKRITQSTTTEVAVTETTTIITAEPPKKRKERRSKQPQRIELAPAEEVKQPPAKKRFDIDGFMDNAIDAEEIAKFNYEVGQRLIRPIRWR
jgi:hypothetical protein